MEEALSDGVGGSEVHLDPCLANVTGDSFSSGAHVGEIDAALRVVVGSVRWTGLECCSRHVVSWLSPRSVLCILTPTRPVSNVQAPVIWPLLWNI